MWATTYNESYEDPAQVGRRQDGLPEDDGDDGAVRAPLPNSCAQRLSATGGRTAAAPADSRVKAILDALQSGKAEAPDMVDLVAKNLLTQERSNVIQGGR